MARTVDELRILLIRDEAGQPDSVTLLRRSKRLDPDAVFPREEVVAQGRSMGDVTKALSQFFGVQFNIAEDAALKAETVEDGSGHRQRDGSDVWGGPEDQKA